MKALKYGGVEVSERGSIRAWACGGVEVSRRGAEVPRRKSTEELQYRGVGVSRRCSIGAWKCRGVEVLRCALSRARARAGVADVPEVQKRLLSANVSRCSMVDLIQSI